MLIMLSSTVNALLLKRLPLPEPPAEADTVPATPARPTAPVGGAEAIIDNQSPTTSGAGITKTVRRSTTESERSGTHVTR